MVGTKDGPSPLYISNDAGATWSSLGPRSTSAWQAVALSGDGSRIYASDGTKLVASASTWRAVTLPCTLWVGDSVLAASRDGRVVAGLCSADSVAVSTDYGASWSTQAGPAGFSARALALSQEGTAIIAAGLNANYKGALYTLRFQRSGVWQWQSAGRSSFPSVLFSLATSADGSVIMAGSKEGFATFSTDGGDTWRDVWAAGQDRPCPAGQWCPGADWALDVSADGRNLLMARSFNKTHPARVRRSRDGGRTWSDALLKRSDSTRRPKWLAKVARDGFGFVMGFVALADSVPSGVTHTVPVVSYDDGASWTQQPAWPDGGEFTHLAMSSGKLGHERFDILPAYWHTC